MKPDSGPYQKKWAEYRQAASRNSGRCHAVGIIVNRGKTPGGPGFTAATIRIDASATPGSSSGSRKSERIPATKERAYYWATPRAASNRASTGETPTARSRGWTAAASCGWIRQHFGIVPSPLSWARLTSLLKQIDGQRPLDHPRADVATLPHTVIS
jgi:hypothetical protein